MNIFILKLATWTNRNIEYIRNQEKCPCMNEILQPNAAPELHFFCFHNLQHPVDHPVFSIFIFPHTMGSLKNKNKVRDI